MTGRQHILPRTELVTTICETLREYPLVFMLAPMGFGKTLAARETAASWPGESVHVSVAPGGDDAEFIWERLCRQLAANNSSLSECLMQAGLPETPAARGRMVALIGEHLAGSTAPLLLIVDDIHLARAKPLAELLRHLALASPENIRILAIGRAVSANLPLVELQAKGTAAVLRPETLRFSGEDTRRLFSRHGIHDANIAHAAHAACEGWPAGIWVLSQACLRGQNIAVDPMVPEMEKLLEEVIFDRLEPNDQHLLLQFSILESACPGHAAAVTGNAAAPRRLSWLCDTNALVRIAASGNEYSLHPLFRRYLLRRLRAGEGGEVDMAGLYRASADWLYGQKRFPEAVRALGHAGREEDMLRTLEILGEHGAGAALLFDPENLPKHIFAIPWEIRLQRVLGYLSFLFVYQNQVDAAKGQLLLAEAEERINAGPFSDEEKLRLHGEILLSRSYSRINDVKGIISWVKKAQRYLRGPSRISGKHLVWTFGCPHVGFVYTRTMGTYAATVRYMDVNLGLFTRITGGCGSGGSAAMRAEYLLETAMQPETLIRAETLAHLAIREAERNGQAAITIAANMTLARIALLEGNPSKALGYMEDLNSHPGIQAHPLLGIELEMARSYILATIGECAAIPAYLASSRPGPDVSPQAGTTRRRQMEFAAVVQAMSLFMEKNAVRLAAMAQDMILMAEGRHAFSVLHGKLFAALAENMLFGREAALPLFRDALETARADGIIMTVAEFGNAILPFMDSLIELMTENKRGGSKARNYLHALKAATVRMAAVTPPVPDAQP